MITSSLFQLPARLKVIIHASPHPKSPSPHPNTGKFRNLILSPTNLIGFIMSERIQKNNCENICIKCGKMYSEHPTTGRFRTVILFGHECAWNPDSEFKGFVRNT